MILKVLSYFPFCDKKTSIKIMGPFDNFRDFVYLCDIDDQR